MSLPIDERVTLVEILELTGTLEEFTEAARAAVRRLEAEGIRSLLSVQFYSQPESTEVGAVLIFADPGEMIRHIRMITGWEEFHRLITTVKPIDVRVHGKLDPEVEKWLGQMKIVPKTFAHHVAGFARGWEISPFAPSSSGTPGAEPRTQ